MDGAQTIDVSRCNPDIDGCADDRRWDQSDGEEAYIKRTGPRGACSSV